MTWDEFTVSIEVEPHRRYEVTEIECPLCGELIYKDNDMMLPSNPPQYEYRCFGCVRIGYAFK